MRPKSVYTTPEGLGSKPINLAGFSSYLSLFFLFFSCCWGVVKYSNNLWLSLQNGYSKVLLGHFNFAKDPRVQVLASSFLSGRF